MSIPGGFMNQFTGDWQTVEYGGIGQKTDDYTRRLWLDWYPRTVRDLVDVIKRTTDDPTYINANAAARILKVQVFLKITDFYGDVPYSEAGLAYWENIFNPKYDLQKDIYDDFFKELSEAESALDPGKDALIYDRYYNGDIAKWKKLANSLRLRIAMRLVKVDPAKAKAEAEEAVRRGIFQSNDDICFVEHDNVQSPTTGEGRACGMGQRFYNNGQISGYKVSQELVGYMEDTKDPRLLYYAGIYFNDPARTDLTQEAKELVGSYRDLALPAQYYSWEYEFGDMTVKKDGKDYKLDKTLRQLQVSKLLQRFDLPYIHVSYAELKFLLAEAAYRGWNVGGSAQQHFSEALDAAVKQWSIFGVSNFNEAAIQEFIQANVLVNGKELEQINTQLWVLHFMDPFELWANWRRSDFPGSEPGELMHFKDRYPTKNNSDGKIPRRSEYPQEEQMKNTTNYKEALDRLPGGKDLWTSRVWWDVEK